ncbi:hypothetical protein ACFVWG_20035 [Kribbella sp. NPDC058245]|uniref:hypothetical protein n=1 Tax=Kribbella sp. NPDC058245 TaxID=3346399 RepID=UPI0036E5B253
MSALPPGAPAVHRAFGRLRSIRTTDADAAEDAVLEALRPLASSTWPEIAWRYGVLTATGYPVELAWTSRDLALRWTSEVAGPEVPEVDRLGIAEELALKLAGVRLDLARWSELQSGRPLRWGAWLGLRQLDNVQRAKVYLELPSGKVAAGPWSEACTQFAARLGDLTWRMAGVNDDGSVELYARTPELTWPDLTAAANLIGAEGNLSALVRELIEHNRAAPPRPSGLSLVLDPSGAPVAVTWFAIAKLIWSNDAAVQEAVLRTTELVNPAAGSVDLYRTLASGPDDGRWRHGMVGIGVDRAGGTWLQTGLRPT